MIRTDYFYKTELLVLSLLKNKDQTCFELTDLIHQHKEFEFINAGKILTALFYLLEANLVSKYIKDEYSYYHIEEAGYTRIETLQREYHSTSLSIQDFIKEMAYE